MSSERHDKLRELLNDRAILAGVVPSEHAALLREIDKLYTPEPKSPPPPITVAELIGELLGHDLNAPVFISHWDDVDEHSYLSEPGVSLCDQVYHLRDGSYRQVYYHEPVPENSRTVKAVVIS